MSTPSPKSPEPSEKTKKYDRQLRLWGDHGQVHLEKAQVCLINATTVGTEILKSMVLAGVGSFTIIDGSLVKEEDLGVNFFFEPDNVNDSKARAATQLLLELNSDVHGEYIDSSIDQLLNDSADFFNPFNLVIATNVPEKSLIKLSENLWEKNIPLITCRSVGFLTYLRVQVREHTVIETHPDNTIFDLRLDKPFADLKQHMDGIDLDKMTLKEHSHVPYLVILYKYLQMWSAANGKDFPDNFREKNQLKELIRKGIRTDENGVAFDEENFEEAIKAVNTVILRTKIPSNVQEILDDVKCLNLTDNATPFWIMARALKDFVNAEGNGCLPLSGNVPDMTADTNSYINLQQVYHKQATIDVDNIYKRVQQLLQDIGKTVSINERTVKLFCRHAHELYVVRGSPIVDEYTNNSKTCEYIVRSLDNPDSMMIYYVMLRGLERFYTEYNLYPGEFDDQVEPDIVKMKACLYKLLNEWGCSPLSKDDYVHEICRYGGSELHSVSAFLGGCVAHEAIKFLTNQYKPVNNTFIYNSVTATSETFTF